MGKLDDATNCAFDVRTTKRATGNGLSKKSSTTFRYSSVNNNLPHFSGFNFKLFCTKLPMYSSRKSGGASAVVISIQYQEMYYFFFNIKQDLNFAIFFLTNNTCLEKKKCVVHRMYSLFFVFFVSITIIFINYSYSKDN